MIHSLEKGRDGQHGSHSEGYASALWTMGKHGSWGGGGGTRKINLKVGPTSNTRVGRLDGLIA